MKRLKLTRDQPTMECPFCHHIMRISFNPISPGAEECEFWKDAPCAHYRQYFMVKTSDKGYSYWTEWEE